MPSRCGASGDGDLADDVLGGVVRQRDPEGAARRVARVRARRGLILDSSAVVAVLDREPGFEELERRMGRADVLEIGAPTLVESAIVVGRARGEAGIRRLSDFLDRMGIVIVPFDEPHADLATVAFLDFGKGRHPARLNFGDCMTYATARRSGRPLLYTGEDFAQTDIQAA